MFVAVEVGVADGTGVKVEVVVLEEVQVGVSSVVRKGDGGSIGQGSDYWRGYKSG